jgi:hypothetical protein
MLADMALGGDWYEGETGSILSATSGGCSGLRDGNGWWLGACMLLWPDEECACGDVCKGCRG